MDLILRKKAREQKRQKELQKQLEIEKVFKHPDKLDNPYSKHFIVFCIIVSILFIAYFLYKSNVLIESSCGLMPGLECKNVKITGENISLEVHNLLKDAMNITINIENCPQAVHQYIRPNTMQEYVFNCGSAEKILKREIQFTYVGYSGLPHDKTGFITGKPAQ